MSSTAAHLFRLFCSFDHCLRSPMYEVGLGGPVVCSKHAKVVRREVEGKYVSELAGRESAR